MSDLGDLFGGIGEFFGGLREAGGEAAASSFVEQIGGETGEDGEYADVVLDRYLTGGPRTLNVNDL